MTPEKREAIPKNLRKGTKIVFEATGEHLRFILSSPTSVDPEPEPTYREKTETFLDKGDPSQAFIDWTRDLSDRLDALVRRLEDER